MQKLSTLTVVKGTVRTRGGNMFSLGKSFDVYAEAEMPRPRGAFDVPYTDDLEILISKGICTDDPPLAMSPLAKAGGSTSLDGDPYIRALADRGKLCQIALAPSVICGSIDVALGSMESASVVVEVPNDGYVTSFSGSGKVVTGSPKMSVKHNGKNVNPKDVTLTVSDVPVSVDLNKPLPVRKGDVIEVVATTKNGEALEDVTFTLATLTELQLCKTDPGHQIDVLHTVGGQGEHVMGGKTYSPIGEGHGRCSNPHNPEGQPWACGHTS